MRAASAALRPAPTTHYQLAAAYGTVSCACLTGSAGVITIPGFCRCVCATSQRHPAYPIKSLAAPVRASADGSLPAGAYRCARSHS
jgi:hypothetical protein